MSIPEQEWLAKAKSLPIGMKIRVRHGFERRENMVIANAQDRWWCYCQRCHEGGVVLKDHVLLTDAPGDAVLAHPNDVRAVQGTEFEIPIARFLASKNMDYVYLPPVLYSESRRRMLLRVERSLHGRDLTGRSPMKWMNYDSARIIGWPGPLGAVVVEDLFSMFKTQYSLRNTPGFGVVCALGTGCSSALVSRLAPAPGIVWFFDADQAGDVGFGNARQRMRPFVQWQSRARPPEGLDPKDMQCASIREVILKEVQWSS